MAITLDQFVQHLTASGLMSAGEIADFQHGSAPENRPRNAEELGKALVQAGKLTAYQASMVWQGKTKGLVFGEYVVFDKIGQGGMGVVLKARHRQMHRIVAVKMLPAAAIKDPDAVQRFYREVRAAARLNHPNIVTAYDAGNHEGAQFLVMEYVDGKDLATIIREYGPAPLPQAIDCILQAARGLQYAHGLGIIHRDIKPANLLLDKQGTLKILDMGLARMTFLADQATAQTDDRLTGTCQVMGTFDYMAPEQAVDTHGADHRADIYSLGCTLYRMLVGKPLYTRQTMVQVLLAHREAPIPSLSAARPDVPPTVEAIFRKMVAKRAEERYQSMAEVIGALESWVPARETQPAGVSSDSDSASSVGAWLERLSLDAGQATGKTANLEETRLHRVEQETTLARAHQPVPRSPMPRTPARNRSLLIGGVSAAAVILVVLIGLLLNRGRSPPEPKRGQETGSALLVSTEAKKAATSKASPPPKVEAKPKEAAWQAAWEEADSRAKALVAGQEYAKAIQQYQALPDQAADSVLQVRVQDAVSRLEELAAARYQEAETRAKQLLAEKKYVEARAAVQPALEQFGIAGIAEQAKKLLGEIEASEKEEQAKAAESKSPQVVETPEQRRRRKAEARYAEALAPVETLAAGWDFRGAMEALGKVELKDREFAERLVQRREELQRLAAIKTRIMKMIATADPPKQKRDLLLRGINGQVSGADEAGITARLPNGKSELHAWGELSEKPRQKLLQLVVDPESADDWVTAGLLAFASKDALAAERFFEKARSLGAKIEPYLVPLAALAYARVEELLQKKSFKEADAALASLEEKYARLPWYDSHKAALVAARSSAKSGIAEAEAEQIYAEAAELFNKKELFDLRPLVEKLKTDYASTRAVTDAQRKPPFAEMEKTIASLGKRLIVRLDGKGDFKSLQEAINSALPNSLIEIQDNGPYNERIVIGTAGLTIRGGKKSWPLITSTGTLTNFPQLVAVSAGGTTLERLVLHHGGAAGESPSCIAGDLRVRSCLLYSPTSFALHHGGCEMDETVVFGRIYKSGLVVANNCLCFWGSFDAAFKAQNTLFSCEATSIGNGTKLRSCTFASRVKVGLTVEFLDCILSSVESSAADTMIENCCVYGNPAFVDRAKPGKGCFAFDPQFVDPANLDYRLKPTSACRGRASDGGDVGCRYTPKMIEMMMLAFELRKRGIIKF